MVKDSAHGFSVKNPSQMLAKPISIKSGLLSSNNSMLYSSDSDDDTTTSNNEQVVKKTLEEKMQAWEATEEEIKNASLGGISPGRADSFDIGLFIAFPFIVGSALLFAVFPFIMVREREIIIYFSSFVYKIIKFLIYEFILDTLNQDKIDVSSVGPPPTI